jgi:hypothetical protein
VLALVGIEAPRTVCAQDFDSEMLRAALPGFEGDAGRAGRASMRWSRSG